MTKGTTPNYKELYEEAKAKLDEIKDTGIKWSQDCLTDSSAAILISEMVHARYIDWGIIL